MIKQALLVATMLAAPCLARAQSTSLLTIMGPTLTYNPTTGKMDVQPGTTPGTPRDAAAAIAAEQAAQNAATTAQQTAQTANNVQPTGLPATRVNADRARDRISIRDFLPAPACNGIADDSPTIYAAATAMAGTNRDVEVPGDCILNLGPAARQAGNRIVLDGMGFTGPGGRDSGAPYGTRGGTFILTDIGTGAVSPFIVKRNARLEHLVFFWPGQTEAAAVANGGTPITTPALLAGMGTAGPGGSSAGASAEVSSLRFLDNDVVNAWDVMDFSGDPAGALQVRGNRMFALDAYFKLSSMSTESFVSDNQFTENAFFNTYGTGIGPTYNLRNWAASNASVVLAVGNGIGPSGSNPAVASTTHIDGLSLTNNVAFGVGYGFRVQGGWLNILAATGNTFDGTAHVVSVEAGGLISSGRIVGGTWFGYTLNNGAGGTGGTTQTTLLYAASTAAPGNTLDVSSVTSPSASGALADWSAPASILNITDVRALGLNNNGGSGTQPGIKFNSAGGRLGVLGNMLIMQGTAPGACVEVDQGIADLTIVGNHLLTCGNPISIAGSVPPTVAAVTGNVSVGTHGNVAYVGSQAPNLMDFANNWDVTPVAWSTNRRSSDGALVASYQGAPQVTFSPLNGGITTTGPTTTTDLAVNGQPSVLGAWTPVTLTATPQTGAFTTVSAGLRYSKPFGGKSVAYDVEVYETTVGTAAGSLTVSGFPFNQGAFPCVLHGREISSTGKALTVTIQPGASTGLVTYYDNSAPLASGLTLSASGTCESAS